MSDDFVEGDGVDIFDPEVASAEEDRAYEAKVVEDDRVVSFLRRRKEAYARVFSAGDTAEDDIAFVLQDLSHFCRAYTSTFNAKNPKVQDLLEGRREVYYRIVENLRLSHDDLLVKHTSAQIRG